MAIIILDIFITNAILLAVFMTGGFFVARLRKRIDTVDIAWGMGFVVVAWATLLQAPSYRNQLIANMVTIWAARLSYHIYSRQKLKSEDPRYIELSRKW